VTAASSINYTVRLAEIYFYINIIFSNIPKIFQVIALGKSP